MERCGEIGLPVTLAMTVTAQNLPHLWETITWGLQFEHCRGVSFQPAFSSGRGSLSTEVRLNTADLILGAPNSSERGKRARRAPKPHLF